MKMILNIRDINRAALAASNEILLIKGDALQRTFLRVAMKSSVLLDNSMWSDEEFTLRTVIS